MQSWRRCEWVWEMGGDHDARQGMLFASWRDIALVGKEGYMALPLVNSDPTNCPPPPSFPFRSLWVRPRSAQYSAAASARWQDAW